jgi:hypothetical protein
MTKQIAINTTPNSIERQTEKAVLINGMGWLPKSQIAWYERDGYGWMVIPAWLFWKKQYSRYNNNGTQIAFDFCESDAAKMNHITAEVHQ